MTGERHVSWGQGLALGAVEYHIIYENNPVGKKLVGLRGNSFHLHRMEKIKKKTDNFEFNNRTFMFALIVDAVC